MHVVHFLFADKTLAHKIKINTLYMTVFLASLKDASCLELVALGNLPPKGGWLESTWSCMRGF